MNRPLILASTAVALCVACAMPAAASTDGRPATYQLTGDAAGSRFEGIGFDQKTSAFYVSETTGGEIHRGTVTDQATAEWLGGDGTDGRWTARGVTVDDEGRVYVAGGPNRIDRPGSPDLWVYDRSGELLAALAVGVDGAFLNDVAIGPDGAAYFTNSNTPQVFRVAEGPTGWTATTWVDASATITRSPGFNLGGIVVTPDRDALVVAQGNVGKLWRFDLATGAVTPIDVGSANLVNADGLVLRGETLTVVRNFSRTLAALRLAPDATSATLVDEVATDPTRVFTTAKIANGRLLLVDSKFDEPQAAPPYEVVALPLNS